MKRLMKKSERSFLSYKKRLIKTSEWIDMSVNDPDAVQTITDVMANGGQIQIQYNEEWKLISPYGWNTSKEGNVLIMCYKDTGEVRSYRLDRIEALQIDSAYISESNSTNEDNQESIEQFDIPNNTETLENEQPESDLPFDDHIEILNVEEKQTLEENEENSSEEIYDNEEEQDKAQ